MIAINNETIWIIIIFRFVILLFVVMVYIKIKTRHILNVYTRSNFASFITKWLLLKIGYKLLNATEMVR